MMGRRSCPGSSWSVRYWLIGAAASCWEHA
jgi:hypothetical protein